MTVADTNTLGIERPVPNDPRVWRATTPISETTTSPSGDRQSDGQSDDVEIETTQP